MSVDDQRQRQLSPDEVARLVAERKKAEAEAEQADERARITTIGSAAMGSAGLVVAMFASLVQQNGTIAGIGFTAAGVAFGIVAAQHAGIFNR